MRFKISPQLFLPPKLCTKHVQSKKCLSQRINGAKRICIYKYMYITPRITHSHIFSTFLRKPIREITNSELKLASIRTKKRRSIHQFTESEVIALG